MIEIFDNIRKIYRFSKPCEELSAYIEFFSESCFDGDNSHLQDELFVIKLFPSWTPTIWINLGMPYDLYLGEDKYTIKAQDDVLILRDSVVERHNQASDHIFTIKFFPGGLEAIFKLNQSLLTNTVADVNAVIPATLLHRIKRLGSFGERMELLQQFFLDVYTKNKTGNHQLQFVQKAIETYDATNMQFNNNQIAGQLFSTSKTISRYFKHVIGTTPKNYFFITRARAALTAYIKHKASFEPTEFGYYDRSHFYKDVVKFTGHKLTEKIPR